MTGFDLVFLLCMGTATGLNDQCKQVHLQSDDGTAEMCTKLAPEIIADWISKQGSHFDGYGVAKFQCMLFGTSLGDDV